VKLQINPEARVTWHAIGKLKSPVMVVDDFLSNAGELRDYALELAYSAPTDFYPGFTAISALPSRNIQRWIAERFLAQRFPDGVPAVFTTEHLRFSAQFSIFACNIDRLPADFEDQHTDHGDWLASIFHLSKLVEGRGTAFWEHRPTGLEHFHPATDALQAERLAQLLGFSMSKQWAQAVRSTSALTMRTFESEVFVIKPGRRPFTTEDDETWHCIHHVPAQFNRMVVYNTWQIHSIVDTSNCHKLDMNSARLTMNQVIGLPVAREVFGIGPKWPKEFYGTVEGLVIE
jgi:hypothetical protein